MEAVTVCTFRQWPEGMQSDATLCKLNLEDPGFALRFDAGWGSETYFGVLCLLGLFFRLEAAVVMHHLPKVPQYQNKLKRVWARLTGSLHHLHATKEQEQEHRQGTDSA